MLVLFFLLSALLSIGEASRLLGVKPATLRSWRLKRKHLPFVQVGRLVRIPADALNKFIRENTIPTREVRK